MTSGKTACLGINWTRGCFGVWMSAARMHGCWTPSLQSLSPVELPMARLRDVRSNCLRPTRGGIGERARAGSLAFDQLCRELAHIIAMACGNGFLGLACFGDDGIWLHVSTKRSAFLSHFPRHLRSLELPRSPAQAGGARLIGVQNRCTSFTIKHPPSRILKGKTGRPATRGWSGPAGVCEEIILGCPQPKISYGASSTQSTFANWPGAVAGSVTFSTSPSCAMASGLRAASASR